MNRFFVRCRLTLSLAFGLLLALCLSVPTVSLGASPFTLEELLLALRTGKPPQAALVKEVNTRFVSFQLTSAIRAQLVAAGARQPLLTAIEFSPQREAAPPAETQGSQPPAPSSAPATAPQESALPEEPTFQGGAVEEMPTGPVTPQEIGTALDGKDDQELLAAMIAARGVSFKYTPDLGRAWREAGASAALLAAVATATVTLPPIPDGFEPVPIARAADYNEQSAKGRLDLRLHVDDIVEVRLQGERVVWKTLKGADGKDAGTEASQPFPMGPLRSLNVTKRDGRGQFVVMQQPTSANNYEMMLRIYDPRGGADRYHLRIDWEHFD